MTCHDGSQFGAVSVIEVLDRFAVNLEVYRKRPDGQVDEELEALSDDIDWPTSFPPVELESEDQSGADITGGQSSPNMGKGQRRGRTTRDAGNTAPNRRPTLARRTGRGSVPPATRTVVTMTDPALLARVLEGLRRLA